MSCPFIMMLSFVSSWFVLVWLWIALICFFIWKAVQAAYWHELQLNSLILSCCLFMCPFKSDVDTNLASHIWQLWFLTLLWTLFTWVCRFPARLKVFLQIMHCSSFLFIWTEIIWPSRLAFEKNEVPHCWHLWSLIFRCICFTCFLKSPLLDALKSHNSQSREAFINAVPDLRGCLVCKVFSIWATRLYKAGRKETQTNTNYSQVQSSKLLPPRGQK